MKDPVCTLDAVHSHNNEHRELVKRLAALANAIKIAIG